ncbi:hypothetical protein [Candidatus Palauibacter sp.]|uniref:hypothetical protein n=1 Tax=Candidatus Palauibacter sp. TaxID=3101350 RepID=UPI003B0133B8
MSPREAAPQSAAAIQELTDEQLDAYILTRLALLGVDLSVLPDDDEDAPADQRRILASARRFLRSTPGAIADFELDPMGPAPGLYPSGLSAWNRG